MSERAAAESAAGVPAATGIHAARYRAAFNYYMRLVDEILDIGRHIGACCRAEWQCCL